MDGRRDKRIGKLLIQGLFVFPPTHHVSWMGPRVRCTSLPELVSAGTQKPLLTVEGVPRIASPMTPSLLKQPHSILFIFITNSRRLYSHAVTF